MSYATSTGLQLLSRPQPGPHPIRRAQVPMETVYHQHTSRMDSLIPSGTQGDPLQPGSGGD